MGRRCLCNGLIASVGLAQTRVDSVEHPLVTSGDDLLRLPPSLLDKGCYSARDVVDYLLA